MTVIVIGISFIAIWLGTTFYIVRYIKKIRDDLLDRFSDTEKLPEKKSGFITAGDGEKVSGPLDYIKRADPMDLLNFIQQEHPQIIALVLAHIESGKASVILQNLPREVQGDVSRRIAAMDRVNPEILRKIEGVLEKKLSAISTEGYSAAGGVESIAEILKRVDHVSENNIIKALEDGDPELACEISKSITLKKTNKRNPERKKVTCKMCQSYEKCRLNFEETQKLIKRVK